MAKSKTTTASVTSTTATATKPKASAKPRKNATPAAPKGTEAGLLSIVRRLNTIRDNEKPSQTLKSVNHTSDVDVLTGNAARLAEFVKSYVIDMQLWQDDYNRTLATLRAYDPSVHTHQYGGLQLNADALALQLTHGSASKLNKAIRADKG